MLLQLWMLLSLPRLSRAAVRVRRVTAQVTKATMSQNHRDGSVSAQAEGGATTAAILIIGDEILKVRPEVV